MREVSGKGIPRVIAIDSGLPRSGKTAFAMNLAVVLAKKKKKVLLFNLDMKSLKPGDNYNHVGRIIKKECLLKEAVVSGPFGLEIIPSWPGSEEPTDLSTIEKINLMSALKDFGKKFDFILIDTGNGRSGTGLFMNIMARETVIVATRGLHSIMAASELMRELCGLGVISFKLTVNNVTSRKQGLSAYELACKLADGIPAYVSYLGSITHDHNVVRAIEKELPVTIFSPESVASINYGEIADWICIEPVRGIREGLQLFGRRK